jgi:hypothetical protein
MPDITIETVRPDVCAECAIDPCECCSECDSSPCECCGECQHSPCQCCEHCDTYPCNTCGECEECPCDCCSTCEHSPCQCCSECECYPCRCPRNSGYYVHSYGYKPAPAFHTARGIRFDAPRRTPTFGFELEVETDQGADMAAHLHSFHPELLYCKEDSSIEGVEIVSHPFTFNWYTESMPHSMFHDSYLRGMLRTTNMSDGYGFHIHVSRTGFKSEAHVLRWLLLIYRNEIAMEKASAPFVVPVGRIPRQRLLPGKGKEQGPIRGPVLRGPLYGGQCAERAHV